MSYEELERSIDRSQKCQKTGEATGNLQRDQFVSHRVLAKGWKERTRVTKLQTKEKTQVFRNKKLKTAKKVVKLFHLLLLSETALQKLGAILYSVVIISASPNNVLCHTLFPFRFHRPISLSEQTAQSIFSQMYCNDRASFVAQKE
ncbi:hypothetical protein RFI_34849 [Reticulomyxa filosa]|uniref:Uncharacterized protein n=1 Tax=Reticulomyxa filosa TaxID=46433 RepID=X6LLS0_RETFI|nr:hypothetical protein RFI_34849 [Reticulomyxa filosa]|eukprot:ETO02569.1 hypothetical protein RFI_34849 [Reticulomyxa filosa]